MILTSSSVRSGPLFSVLCRPIPSYSYSFHSTPSDLACPGVHKDNIYHSQHPARSAPPTHLPPPCFFGDYQPSFPPTYPTHSTSSLSSSHLSSQAIYLSTLPEHSISTSYPGIHYHAFFNISPAYVAILQVWFFRCCNSLFSL
ncbi:hypothetical protein BDQ17DRAFT_475865 [Cyathus striatus]|nr:hypothetical protein BDQ17DRAFT_475865 [Cyathus striatus]